MNTTETLSPTETPAPEPLRFKVPRDLATAIGPWLDTMGDRVAPDFEASWRAWSALYDAIPGLSQHPDKSWSLSVEGPDLWVTEDPEPRHWPSGLAVPLPTAHVADLLRRFDDAAGAGPGATVPRYDAWAAVRAAIPDLPAGAWKIIQEDYRAWLEPSTPPVDGERIIEELDVPAEHAREVLVLHDAMLRAGGTPSTRLAFWQRLDALFPGALAESGWMLVQGCGKPRMIRTESGPAETKQETPARTGQALVAALDQLFQRGAARG